MSEERVVVERHRDGGARGITGAIILIGLGIAFLLQNLGVVSFDWFSLLRYWPVLLILVGIDLLLGRSAVGSIIAAVLGIVLVAGVLYLASSDTPTTMLWSGRAVTRDITEYELDADVEVLTVNLDIGAAAVRLDAGAAEGIVVQGDYRTNEELFLQSEYDVVGDTGELVLRQEGEDSAVWAGPGLIGEIDMSLTDAVPVDLAIDSGASDLNLDLSGMQLNSLTINGGVGTIDVQLPAAGDYEVVINGGIGTVNLALPDSMEARVSVDGLTTSDLPARFEQISDGLWGTGGYESAEDRASIIISTGIGTVNIR